jgi:hypothetical protein
VLPELETVVVVDAEAPAGMDDVGVAEVLAEKDTVDVEDTLAPGASDCVADVLVLLELDTWRWWMQTLPWDGTTRGRRRARREGHLVDVEDTLALVRATLRGRCARGRLSSRPWRWWMQALPLGWTT